MEALDAVVAALLAVSGVIFIALSGRLVRDARRADRRGKVHALARSGSLFVTIGVLWLVLAVATALGE